MLFFFGRSEPEKNLILYHASDFNFQVSIARHPSFVIEKIN